MAMNNSKLEKTLWDAADNLRFADYRFTQTQKELDTQATGRRRANKISYRAKGVICLPVWSGFWCNSSRR